MMKNSAVLTISCVDQEGIVAAVTALLSRLGANIIYLDQHVDRENGLFFMRVEWDLDQFEVELSDFETIFIHEAASRYAMQWELSQARTRQKMALFVSKMGHCFYDILGRWKNGELAVDIPLVISNHPDLKEAAESFGIPFYHIPVTAQTREEKVAQQLALLKKYEIDFITLARYMQIVPPSLIDAYPYRIINIHHSFLPGFPGAKPYHQAYERGVKLIGATGHYVTEELDAGPIIEQDVERVNHTYTVADLRKIGQDIERQVLARAVAAHVERRVLAYGNRTVVFS